MTEAVLEWFKRIDSLIPRLPVFLAVPLQEVGDDLRSGRARPALFAVCEAAEAFVRFLVVGAGSEIIARSGGVAPDWLGKAAANTLERPTFGSLVRLLDAIAKQADLELLEELPKVWPEVAEALFAPGGAGEPAERRSLVALRNPLAHGTGINDQYARELLDFWGPRFANAIARLSWLTDVELWARDVDPGALLLRGCEPIEAPAPDPAVAALAAGEIAMRRAGKPIPLVPFAYHRSPREAASPVAQLFMRTGTVGLLYGIFTPADVLQTEGLEEERARFEAIFDLARWRRAAQERVFQERGYEREFEAEARGFVGRDKALETLWAAVVDRPQGLVAVLGPAGIGKSSLVARATIDLRGEIAERVRGARATSFCSPTASSTGTAAAHRCRSCAGSSSG